MTRSIGAREPGLPKHELLKLIRIQRQSVKKYHAQQETVKHLADIKRRQTIQNYETELDNLRAAAVHSGPLRDRNIERIADIRKYIGKRIRHPQHPPHH